MWTTILEVIQASVVKREVGMWNYLRRKVANNPTVKKMSPAQKKRVGGRIILTGTLLLIVPLTSMLLSYSSVWMHVSFQIIWGTTMIIGSLIAFESDEKRSGTR
jgi:hypothetical protein